MKPSLSPQEFIFIEKTQRGFHLVFRFEKCSVTTKAYPKGLDSGGF